MAYTTLAYRRVVKKLSSVYLIGANNRRGRRNSQSSTTTSWGAGSKQHLREQVCLIDAAAYRPIGRYRRSKQEIDNILKTSGLYAANTNPNHTNFINHDFKPRLSPLLRE